MAAGMALCMALGTSAGICPGEIEPVAVHAADSLPEWATPAWREWAAHIVEGEIPYGCAECARWVACTMVRDVARGWGPWALGGRWYGWKNPTPLARDAIRRALEPAGCLGVPDCQYLGNQADYWRHWHPLPMVTTGNLNGDVVCVLREGEDVNERTATAQGGTDGGGGRTEERKSPVDESNALSLAAAHQFRSR